MAAAALAGAVAGAGAAGGAAAAAAHQLWDRLELLPMWRWSLPAACGDTCAPPSRLPPGAIMVSSGSERLPSRRGGEPAGAGGGCEQGGAGDGH